MDHRANGNSSSSSNKKRSRATTDQKPRQISSSSSSSSSSSLKKPKSRTETTPLDLLVGETETGIFSVSSSSSSSADVSIFDFPWQKNKSKGALYYEQTDHGCDLRDVFFSSLVDGCKAAIGVPGDRLSPSLAPISLPDGSWPSDYETDGVDCMIWSCVLREPLPLRCVR